MRKTMSGLIKLLFPDKNITRDELEWLLKYAIEGRRRVKEQLKIMAGIGIFGYGLGILRTTMEMNVIVGCAGTEQ